MDKQDEIRVLATQAREGVRLLNLPSSQRHTDIALIEAMEESDNVEWLRVFAAYAGVFRPEFIMGTNLYVSLSEMTDEHIWVYGELDKAYEENLFGNKEEQRVLDAFTEVLVHAMRHVEDGRLIVSLIKDRGIVSLDKIVDVIPVLKANGVSALTEGNL